MLLTYIEENFTIHREARWIIDNLIDYTKHQPEYVDDEGNLTDEGIDFLWYMLDSIGMDRDEIADHWKED